jgi:hypothetical protein
MVKVMVIGHMTGSYGHGYASTGIDAPSWRAGLCLTRLKPRTWPAGVLRALCRDQGGNVDHQVMTDST